MHTFVELSHLPTPPALNICIDLSCEIGCHVDLFPQPPSSLSVDPMDCTVLFSPIPDSTLVVHEDQVVDRVGVVKPACVFIHDECVQEFEEEFAVKDDLLLSTTHPVYSNIPCDSAISGFPYENLSSKSRRKIWL